MNAQEAAKKLLESYPDHALRVALEVVRLVASEMAEAAKREASATRRLQPIETPTRLCEVTAMHFNIRLDQLMSSTRFRRYTGPRAVAMWLCRKRLAMSFTEIGEHFERDHTSVMSACDKIDRGIYPASDAHRIGAVLDAQRVFGPGGILP